MQYISQDPIDGQFSHRTRDFQQRHPIQTQGGRPRFVNTRNHDSYAIQTGSTQIYSNVRENSPLRYSTAGPPEDLRRSLTSPSYHIPGNLERALQSPVKHEKQNMMEYSFSAHRSPLHQPQDNQLVQSINPFTRNSIEKGNELLSRSRSGEKRHSIVPPSSILKPQGSYCGNPIEIAIQIEDLLKEAQLLRKERDEYKMEAHEVRDKNQELLNEFDVLRSLINETSKPTGFEENLMLRTQYQNEKDTRVAYEQDVNRLRQQISDAEAQRHTDIINLKQAIDDQHVTNYDNLKNIYRTQDTCNEQMQQMEDLSKMIRQKDKVLDDKDQEIEQIKNINRQLHSDIIVCKQEAAQVSGQ